MPAFMIPPISKIREPLITMCTGIRFFTGMDPHVYTKVAFFSKTFIAALVGALEAFADILIHICMLVDYVFFKAILPRESAVAGCTEVF